MWRLWKAIWCKIQSLKFYQFQQTPININHFFLPVSTNRFNVNINSVSNSTIQKAFYINTDFCFTTKKSLLLQKQQLLSSRSTLKFLPDSSKQNFNQQNPKRCQQNPKRCQQNPKRCQQTTLVPSPLR